MAGTVVDADGLVAWEILGTIGRINAAGRWTTITVAELDAFDEDEWTGLVVDTPGLTGPLTTAQRALVRLHLAELADVDLTEPDRWWER